MWVLGLMLTGGIMSLGCVSDPDSPDENFGEDESVAASEQALMHVCSLGQNCSSAIATLLSSMMGSTYRINMSGYQRMDLFASVCNPTGWTLHVTDSPTADGYGGDGATTDHDAEGYLFSNTQFQYFSSFEMSRWVAGNVVTNKNAFPGGCKTVHIAAIHPSGSASSTFRFEGDTANPSYTTDVQSLYGMKLGYTACATSTSSQRAVECDWEDAALGDKNYWYIGLNRTVGSSSRFGTGVSSACIVLNSDPNANPSSCL